MVKLLAVLVLAGASVKAQNSISGDWMYYIDPDVDPPHVIIQEYQGTGGVVQVPSEIDGVPVKKFGNGSSVFWNENITSVSISDGVTSIDVAAFSNCFNLTNVTLPNSVTSIGLGAFENCTSLTSINFPNGVTNIGGSAFENCTSLTSINLPNGVTNIGLGAFRYCTSLTNITMPDRFITQINQIGFTGQVAADFLFNALASNNNFVTAVATNDAFVTAVANKILAASNNYGLATKTEVGGAVTMGVQQVLSAPSDYNLFTTQQVQNERTAGQNDVLNTPNSFSLYTTNQIHNLGFGGIVLNRNTNNQLVLNYQVLQSTDLQSWSPYQQTELVISNAPSDKMFLRVQAVGQ